MNNYDAWRESEVKRVGLDKQLKAEALLDRHAAEPFVEVNDERGGSKMRVRRNIADILRSKRHVSASKSFFGVPNLPWLKK